MKTCSSTPTPPARGTIQVENLDNSPQPIAGDEPGNSPVLTGNRIEKNIR
ncbi:MAG: hypothetical protein J6S75_06475 [Thermoguttaceae bacterium]|nr:hypothetical protein [Thermoguttaceae bacterium]